MKNHIHDQIPNLNIERMDDGIGDGLIILEQDDNCGTVHSLAIHPIHLRYMAEKMGLVETNDPQACKTIARLSRQLLTLNERIQHLDKCLGNCLHDHLDYEQSYAEATSDIAREFCADLVDMPSPMAQPVKVAPTAPAPAPATQGKKAQASVVPQASLI